MKIRGLRLGSGFSKSAKKGSKINYLTHILVVGTNADHQVGAFLGDFVKGPLTSERPLAIEQGIWHHRQLDAWSNQHCGLRQVVQEFGSNHRRVAPILLDLFIDHFLCRYWPDHCSVPLAQFSQNFYQSMFARRSLLPDRAQHWLEYASENDLLAGYGDLRRLANIVHSMDQRRRKPLGLVAAFEAGIRHYSLIEEGFFQVFPEIIWHSDQLNAELPSGFMKPPV